ncbi:hypothetical protein BTVI_136506 [Pitangus sulphuratus]|nr:hypothetical protein BTVI_136506 [Pitangus sulphuratus]
MECHPEGPDKLKEWPMGNLMKFNKAKCKVLHLGRGNPRYQSSLDEQTESNPAEKDLGVLVDERLDVTRPCALTALNAKHILGCTKSSAVSRVKEGIPPLCSTLLSPQVESCSQLCGPQDRRDINLLKGVTHRGESPRWSEGWDTSPVRTGWENWDCSPQRTIRET